MTKLIQLIIIVILPIIISLSTIRLLPSTFFLEYEYSKNDFPKDKFGFSKEERIKLAREDLKFLNSRIAASEAISILQNQTFPDSNTPLYNEREIKHLVDVKNIYDSTRKISKIVLITIAGAIIFLIADKKKRIKAYKALMFGGLLILAVVTGFLLFIATRWEIFFLQFHELLFPPETWLFYETDTLIRLYPEKFWFDFGIAMVILIFVQAIVITLTGNILYHHVKSNQLESRIKRSIKKG